MTVNLSSRATEGRHDLYGNIHKALRLGHCQMLTRLGAADFTADQAPLLADLRVHLAVAAAHLAHEDAHVHPALEGRAPGACAGLEAEHASHRRRFAELEAAIAAVAGACPAERPAYGRALYLQFTVLAAEDFLHMAEEETVTAPRLCALFTDRELGAIHGAILADIKPGDQIAVMRLMIPAISRTERAALLGGMKLHAPAAAYAAVIEQAARPALPPEEFAALGALGLAA